jgi:peptidoglycan/LPS O-acetylase OafA/YrhL
MKSERIKGFDSLRFVLASWVVFGHFGFFPLIGIDQESSLGRIAFGIYNNLVSAPAAVIVFFVISGFCIHYPYRRNDKPALLPFFTRRYIRIITPMVLSLLIALPLKISVAALNSSILWSLFCEEVYYVIYPGLVILKQRYGWRLLIGVSFGCAALVMLTNIRAENYHDFGFSLNWLLGLPCWLLGCYLAEQSDSLRGLGWSGNIWAWRFTAWFLTFAASVLRFHSPLKYPLSLSIFSVFVFFWIRKELVYYNTHEPNRYLEKGGKWSYSIYLMHPQAHALLLLLALPAVNGVVDWMISMTFIFLICYVFYRLVERPSHLLARSAARRFTERIVPSSSIAPAEEDSAI